MERKLALKIVKAFKQKFQRRPKHDFGILDAFCMTPVVSSRFEDDDDCSTVFVFHRGNTTFLAREQENGVDVKIVKW